MKKIILSVLALFIGSSLWALPTVGESKRPAGLNKTAAGCNQPTSTIDLDINNVRARIMTGGDMWWDRSAGLARYAVPKTGRANALFAGSIWIGGIDVSTNDLKVAAQTYRSRGNDYWTGPLDENDGASIDFQTCSEWDRFWKINKADVTTFRDLFSDFLDADNRIIPGREQDVQDAIFNNDADIVDVIREWPGQNSSEAIGSSGGPLAVPDKEMAPFVDVDNDGVYNWRKGDYPSILGDQYIWYVFNDKGDAKTQTQSDAINVEIHLGAFAFATGDCLNDATFYNYRVFNWSSAILDSTYMATWTDADMGFAFDDFIGCDTARGLGILYNGDGNDETTTGYGTDIPMVGVDFFRGPRIINPLWPNSPNQFIELKMSVFTYFNNGAGNDGDPTIKSEFYNYMTGSWKNGNPFVWGCDPLNGGGVPAASVFPDDPCKGGISEPDCNRSPWDRRFVHSAGPYQLYPGIVPSDVTIGCVWVPSAGSGKSACFSKILVCDDKAQDLFDRDFQLPDGPQAPDLEVRALDRKLVMKLTNPTSSNNEREGYGRDLSEPKFIEAVSKAVKRANPFPDSLYKFEGYIVYQLRDASVATSEITNKDGSLNTDAARIVFQCDIDNGVKEIFNFELDPEISSDYYSPRLMVTGKDSGLRHSFAITEDAFATTTSKELVNYKTYYYMAIAYAYNKFDNDGDGIGDDFDPQNAANTQDRQYINSRVDGRGLQIRVISAIPTPANDSMYVQNHADYGTGIQLTQIEGIGNGGQELELTQGTITNILNSSEHYDPNPTYQANRGPAELFVVDPNEIIAGDYELSLNVRAAHTFPNEGLGAIADSTKWQLKNVSTGQIVYGERDITEYNDQLIRWYDSTNNVFYDWGLSVNMEQVLRPGDDDSTGENALITSDITFADVSLPWLSGVADAEGQSFNNWIRAGEQTDEDPINLPNSLTCEMNDWAFEADRVGAYEDVIFGTWAPYVLTNQEAKTECGNGVSYSRIPDRILQNMMKRINSVDIVFTSDKSLWSKCPVIEMTDHNGTQPFGKGDQFKYNIRKHASWDKEVDANGNAVYSTTETGWSWFPGYAINVETGERLNIFFGEESFNGVDNGNDMIFNPTSTMFDRGNFKVQWGGKHVVYVQTTRYDEGAYSIAKLKEADAGTPASKSSQNNNALKEIYNNIMWVGNVLKSGAVELASLKDGIIPTETRVRIRVERPYAKNQPDPNVPLVNDGWPLYRFSTKDLAPKRIGEDGNLYTNDKDALLKRILPVPNPYYAYSEYEGGRLDNRMKIINLPEKAEIKIYSVDGTLIRTLTKNDPATSFIDWDLKNNKDIPIASGMYLIHVNIDGIGETVLKWFGAMRPVDITSL